MNMSIRVSLLEAGYPFAAEAAGRLRSVLEELKDLGASAAAIEARARRIQCLLQQQY